MSKHKIETSKRSSAFADLKDFCVFAMVGDKDRGYYLETTTWSNGEGFDVEILGVEGKTIIQLTWGEWDAMKACVKAMNKSED